MLNKCIIIISKLVDATIREYQPDVDIHIFKSIEALAEYIDKTPIRADSLFFTKDVAASNNSFSYLRTLVSDNDFLGVDKVIYITEEGGTDIDSFNYIKDSFDLSNWELIEGFMQRDFMQEVINGTYRSDEIKAERKVVVRRPRADYIREQLRQHDSLEEPYVSDEQNFQEIPDEELPQETSTKTVKSMRKVFIAGLPCRERTAFTVLVGQYLACQNKVLLVESDPEYHLLTEFITKAEIECTMFSMTDLYNDLPGTIKIIKECTADLIVISCIDRIDFSYKFITTLLTYNLADCFDYMLQEIVFEDVPFNTEMVVVIPNTMTGILKTCDMIDKANLPYCSFVGVNLCDLPETHVNNSIVVSNVLQDILSDTSITCTVVTMNTLRLGSTVYDLGHLLERSIL